MQVRFPNLSIAFEKGITPKKSQKNSRKNRRRPHQQGCPGAAPGLQLQTAAAELGMDTISSRMSTRVRCYRK